MLIAYLATRLLPFPCPFLPSLQSYQPLILLTKPPAPPPPLPACLPACLHACDSISTLFHPCLGFSEFNPQASSPSLHVHVTCTCACEHVTCACACACACACTCCTCTCYGESTVIWDAYCLSCERVWDAFKDAYCLSCERVFKSTRRYCCVTTFRCVSDYWTVSVSSLIYLTPDPNSGCKVRNSSPQSLDGYIHEQWSP